MKDLPRKLFFTLVKILPDIIVEKRYIKAGGIFGEAVSYLAFGESENLDKLFKRWERWELVFAGRSYKTFSVDSFIMYGGYGYSDKVKMAGVKCGPKENPVLHAKIYEAYYLGKIPPAITPQEVAARPGEVIHAVSIIPSTEIFLEES